VTRAKTAASGAQRRARETLYGQLPVETTGFIGREAELARLSGLLEQARLITVTGPGGVGKSRLALRAAAAAAPGFADGVCLVELSALREPGLLVHTVAGALGLPEQSHGSHLDAVLAHLSDRHLLLILDTCEHLIDACAMFAEAVVARAPRVTLLATSREPLDVSGENACPVAPLPVPRPPDADADAVAGSAVELFLQRASAAVPGFTVTTDDLPDVIGLCQRLDGIPLAIELAAVRLRALPLDELAGRLDQRLALLTSGQRGGRHRTLRDAISWSHDLCTPAEQAMWARLSVFAGPFTMSAAEEVCADGPADQVMPTVVRLVDKSVIVRIDAADADGTPTQYRMLDTFREFGAERLGGSGDASGTRRRFVARYLAMARYFRDHFLDDDQLTRMRELRREHANVRAALEYAFSDEALVPRGDDAPYPPMPGQADGVELAIALSAYWRARGLAHEGSYWLGRAAGRAREGSAARGRAVLERGHLLAMEGDAAGALAAAAQAIALAGPLGDKALAAWGYLVKAAALCGKGRLAAAAESGDEARRRLTALDDQLGLASLDIQLTYLALLNDDIEAALGHVERGLRQLSGSRERWLHANLYMLASVGLYLAGRDIESTWTATRALQVKQEIGDVLGMAFTLELLGWLAARSGSHQRAAWLLGGADPLWERAGGRLTATASFGRLHTEAVARCGGALGGKLFAELFTRGVRHPVEPMIAFALNDVGDPAAGSGTKIRLPSQLTVREREIASLVAAGLSNRQIGDMLFISRRTVDAHLEHIFGKLGITSRVMLTIQLREHSAATDAGANA
jgi:predicted ATPase/DNA-binding CsgD family transcriptional regulator